MTTDILHHRVKEATDTRIAVERSTRCLRIETDHELFATKVGRNLRATYDYTTRTIRLRGGTIKDGKKSGRNFHFREKEGKWIATVPLSSTAYRQLGNFRITTVNLALDIPTRTAYIEVPPRAELKPPRQQNHTERAYSPRTQSPLWAMTSPHLRCLMKETTTRRCLCRHSRSRCSPSTPR